MLSRLHIKNMALVDEADIEFGAGLNILSGETGSGKSVILDSINFVLGSKADKTMIRSGESQASVRAEFTVSTSSGAIERLNDLDIETDGNIIITRRFAVDGKGAIKINGDTVTASMLKSVTQLLVDVHGQSEHFYLLDEDNQLKVIDNLCGEEGEKIKENLTLLIEEKRGIKQKIASLGGDAQERERKLDLLSYQINEIEEAKVKVGEFDELNSKRIIFNNAEKIISAINTVQECLDNDGSCVDLLSTSIRQFSQIAHISQEYGDLLNRLENLRTEAEDISATASDLADDLSFDEREAELIEGRISLLKTLFKKYGSDEESVLAFLNGAKKQYELLNEGAEAIEKYNRKIGELDNKIFELCQNLTKIRKTASELFSKNVEQQLKSLNIPHAKFSVDFTPYGKESAKLNSKDGSDEICFKFSANKGEPTKPLNKVISGGEMSRLMLAIKTQLKSDEKGISTYIFDEIDAGISGFTATTVAEKFIEISKNTQILAVSHLPQVSAASDNQYLIYKIDADGKTVTRVKKLSREEKVEEIIRLTGSINSQAAKTHAEELISQFKH